MPLINYLCACGKSTKKYLKSAKDALPSVKCECGLNAVKSFGATSSSHKITVDNGLMARKVEVDPNINEINDERSSRDYSEEE